MGHTPLSYLGIPMTPKASFTNPLQSMIEVNTSNETTEEGDNKHTGHIADSSGCAILVTTWKDGTPRVMSAGLSQNGSTLVFRPTDFTESKKDFKLLSDSLRKSEVDKDQRGCSLEPSQQKHSEVKIDGINDIREVCYEDKETKRINVHIEGVENSSERKKHKPSQRTQSEMKNDDLNDGREVCNDGKTITRTKDHMEGVANSTERKKHKPSQRIHSDMKNDDMNDGREICNGREETEETNDEIKGVAHSFGIKKHKSPSSKSDVTDSNKVIGKETTERIHSHIDKARPDNEKTGLNETLIQSNSVSNLLTNNQSSDQEKCKKVERRSSICEERPTKTQEITQNNIEGIPDKQHGHERVKNSETRTVEKMDQQRKDRYVDKTQLVNHEQLGTECSKSTGTVKVHKTPIIKKNVKENTFEKTHSMANKCQSYEGDKTNTTHTKLSNSDHCVNNVDKANVQSLSEGLSTKRPLVDVEKERKNVKERTFGQTHSIENKCKTIDGDKISRTNTELRNKSEHGVNKIDKADVQETSKKVLPNEKAVYEEKERKSVNERRHEKKQLTEKNIHVNNSVKKIKTNTERRDSGNGVEQVGLPIAPEQILTKQTTLHVQKGRHTVDNRTHEKTHLKEKKSQLNNSVKTTTTHTKRRVSVSGGGKVGLSKASERILMKETTLHKKQERSSSERTIHGESADSESPSHVSSRTSDDTKSKSSPTQSIKHGNCTPIIINTSGKLNLEEVRWQFPDKTKAPGSNENPSKSLDVLPKRKYGDHLHDGDVSSSEMKKRRMYVAEMFDELPKRLLEKQTYPEIKTISEENTTDNAKKTESYSPNNTERSTSMSQAKHIHKSIRQLMGAAKVHLKSSESSNADKPSANGQKESVHGCEGSLEHAGENVYMGETINVDKTAVSGDEERTTTFKCQLCNHSCLDIRKFEKHKLLCKTKEMQKSHKPMKEGNYANIHEHEAIANLTDDVKSLKSTSIRINGNEETSTGGKCITANDNIKSDKQPRGHLQTFYKRIAWCGTCSGAIAADSSGIVDNRFICKCGESKTQATNNKSTEIKIGNSTQTVTKEAEYNRKHSCKVGKQDFRNVCLTRKEDRVVQCVYSQTRDQKESVKPLRLTNSHNRETHKEHTSLDQNEIPRVTTASNHELGSGDAENSSLVEGIMKDMNELIKSSKVNPFKVNTKQTTDKESATCAIEEITPSKGSNVLASE